jgi:hypothetical protein
MRLPKQAKPVMHMQTSASAYAGTVKPSDLECDLCLIACNQLGGIAKQICIAACYETGLCP